MRLTIRDVVSILENEYGQQKEIIANEIEAYLSNITAYMLDKGFTDPAMKVLSTAIDEIEKLGYQYLQIPTLQIKRLLQTLINPNKLDKKMKSYSETRAKIFNAAIEVLQKGYQ